MHEALAACPGVKNVKVDFASKTATAIVEDGVADPEKLLAAVKAAGYEDSTLK